MALAQPSLAALARPLAAISPTLGAVGSYSVLAGSQVTNSGPTSMPGDLGVSPSIGVPPHVIGFPPGSAGPPGTIHDADAHAAAAQADNTAAFAFIDQICDVSYAGTKDLAGENLVAGVYCADAFQLSGTLILSGAGVWIFKSASDLVTSGAANVVGGDACNVWWRVVSSATLGTSTSFIGNILALTSISLQTNASLQGRALAQTGQVSLDSNVITGAACLTTSPAPTPTATPLSVAGGGAGITSTGGSSDDDASNAGDPNAVIGGLPDTGGAPIRTQNFALNLLVFGIVTALILGVLYRRASQTRR
ncbi:MAG: DUF3494 domain-containing protein [Anaerolineales bacterium]|nr:DUF3494 domain-containing protein [Anaerolineales bacterium]MCW5854687.1 DUF3494 domain-containing protein [Anaerolineales bacterium]